ncbi:MAG: bifunctional SulP family inorganic anion transporter/carbonic anhydrase [Pirellulaceae bacterium]|nr:bifunctional SulP family inorganic anion transporter/carbonic anhydrase [Pirellulaceae bacterium]
MSQAGSVQLFTPQTVFRDLAAGLVVFLVALPLCLGVALASDAPLSAGLMAGVVGGILVGLVSRSHTSVSGPAAGLTAIVASQIAKLGSFEAFLLAVVFAGVIQIGLGVARAGFIAAFFPSSVIKGLLAAIGVILILKQFPHLLGRDTDPEGEMAFQQPDHETTFSELGEALWHIHPGALAVGLFSIVFLVLWDRIKPLKKSPVPAPLLVVLCGVAGTFLSQRLGGFWLIEPSHLVQVPLAEDLEGFRQFLRWPAFDQVLNPAIYMAAVTIAVVASLETLLNLEAVDKLDPQQRKSPPSRELFAQGVGNVACGLLGGLPVTSVIVRSSVNISAGGRTKLATIVHGVLVIVCVALVPQWLNLIPLSCLAAILMVTGFKLASPKLVRQMWKEGRNQFLPFVVTVVAIVLTDLLIGILIGLAISLGFILHSNFRRPLRRIVEKHASGEVLRIELSNQVSFLNRAVLQKTLASVPRGGHVLLDARNTDYIDPDILDLIADFRQNGAPAHQVEVSLVGFKDRYQMEDAIQYVDYSTRDLQESLTPDAVLRILKEGHQRFREGHTLMRNLARQRDGTAGGQFPMAVVLSCIDSRCPVEFIFDVGLGDIFTIRVAGNVAKNKVLGSMEYGCAVAGAKLVLVVGHTRCGAVRAAVDLGISGQDPLSATGCDHLETLISEIQLSIEPSELRRLRSEPKEQRERYTDEVARRNVHHTLRVIREQSRVLDRLARQGKIRIVGALYDVCTGDVDFFE